MLDKARVCYNLEHIAIRGVDKIVNSDYTARTIDDARPAQTKVLSFASMSFERRYQKVGFIALWYRCVLPWFCFGKSIPFASLLCTYVDLPFVLKK